MFDTRLGIISVAGLLAACATTAWEAPSSRACGSEAAVRLVGHAAPDDAAVKRRTGADLIRRIAPDDPVTHDFQVNRITLEINLVGKVVQALCG